MDSGPAISEGGRAFWRGGSGKWATEQLIRGMKENKVPHPDMLRTLDVLRPNDWIAFDTAVIEGAKMRLHFISDMIAAGLTIPLANAMAKTVLEYDLIGDMDPATVSMDGMARSDNDTVEFDQARIPLPITHKDFFINLRKLMASRASGEGLDTLQGRVSGRKIGEEVERMGVLGGKTFQQLPIYGLLTHPKRNTVSFGAGGSWNQGAKTSDQIVADIFTMMGLAAADGFYGPYWVYYPKDASLKMEADYKASSDISLRERVMAISGIQKFEVLDQLTTANVVLVQATQDVIAVVNGIQPQTIQWDVNGGFGINFKAFAIQIPLIRADINGNSGVVHMS
jgi:hypothetical protein